MRTFGYMLLVMLLGTFAAWYLGWLAYPLVAGLAAFYLRPRWAWGIGFCSGALAWTMLAWGIEVYTEGIMGTKISQLFLLGESPVYALSLTALVGGASCAFPALTGKWTALHIKAKKDNRRRSVYGSTAYHTHKGRSF